MRRRGKGNMIVRRALAGIDVPVTEAVRALEAGEVQRDGAGFILEVCGAVFVLGRVDTGAEIHRRLPTEVVAGVFAMGSPDVRAAHAAGAVAAEVDPVAVGREGRRVIVTGATERFHLSRSSPRVAQAVAVRHVEVTSLDGA